MTLLAAVRLAWRALSVNLMRSMLTMLGIIIGVAAVITMIAIGTGAQQRVEEQIRALGSNLLLVMPGTVTQGGARLGAQTGQNHEQRQGQIGRAARDVKTACFTARQLVCLQGEARSAARDAHGVRRQHHGHRRQV